MQALTPCQTFGRDELCFINPFGYVVNAVVPKPPPIVIWWKAIRPATLWAGVAPVFVGSGLAGMDQTFKFVPALIALVGAILIQIGCNLVNDYSDFETGADDENRLGPDRAAQKGWLSVEQLKRGAQVSLALAGLTGAYLTWVGGWPILVLGVLSIICAIAYTAGPFPLGYLGLGDVFVMLFFGFGAVAGTYFVQAGTVPEHVWPWCWAVGALATAILVVNNLRDRVGDASVGKRTLAVRFGASFARLQYTLLVVSAFAVPGYSYLSISGSCNTEAWIALCPLVVLPLGIMLIYKVWATDGEALNPLLGQTAGLELLFCLLATVSFVLR